MDIEVFDLGLIDFKEALRFQKQIFETVKMRNLSNALIVCRHQPVITLGRNADEKNVLTTVQELTLRRIQICLAERGGDVTYHGPGQLIAYPVFNLHYFKKDISLFLRYLEKIIIDFLSDFGIKGSRISNLTGVWVNKRKIASIGIAIRNWIAFYGLSINIKTDDLHNFCLIRPCGLDVEMTSLETELNRNIDINVVKENLILKFRDTFQPIGQGVPSGDILSFNCEGVPS
jgi:lipoyl(octanoyl) transferase